MVPLICGILLFIVCKIFAYRQKITKAENKLRYFNPY